MFYMLIINGNIVYMLHHTENIWANSKNITPDMNNIHNNHSNNNNIVIIYFSKIFA